MKIVPRLESEHICVCVFLRLHACFHSICINYAAVVLMCIPSVCFYMFTYMSVCVFCVGVCVCLCVFTAPFNHAADSVALAAGGFSVMRLPSRPSRQPGGDGVRGGLLGHAVVTDHCVEAAPRVGILGSVVGLQRGWDTPLVLRGSKRRLRLITFINSFFSKGGE